LNVPWTFVIPRNPIEKPRCEWERSMPKISAPIRSMRAGGGGTGGGGGVCCA
jgi:hypothetical protein